MLRESESECCRYPAAPSRTYQPNCCYTISLYPQTIHPPIQHIYRHNGHYITLTNIYKANSIHDCLGLGYTHSIDAGIFKNKREDSSRRRREQG